MEQRVQEFFRGMRGKRVAFCGIGGSNLPLVKIFHEYGALVTACDRRSREALGEAAKELEAMGVALKLGDDYLQNLDVDVLFRTPGMRFHLPELDQARQKGIAVTSEMEVFFALCPCKIYAVTGSDGKTTTTTILSELLKAAGKRVHLGGNIGRPLLPDLELIQPEDVAVVELSSFQLISMHQSPHVAVVTNLSPNHLDIHKDMAEYVEAKKNIFLHQDAFSKTVLNLENEWTRSFGEEVRGQRFFFSSAQPCEYGAWLRGDTIVMQEKETVTEVVAVADIKIPGKHNIENYLAAITAIDPSLYEAASIDGAGRWAKIRYITLPGIKPTIMILLLMNVGNVLNAGFEVQYILGNGLVQKVSQTIDIYVLNWGISQNDYSLGTAAGIFKSAVSIVLILLANRMAKRSGEESLF